jgi:hypothetical protein
MASLADPLPVDIAVRETAPAVWIPKYGFWAVGRHADVTAIFGDWKRFSSAAGTGLTHNRKENPWRKPSVILEVDPPQHTKTRAVLTRILSRPAMQKLRQDFQARADELVDRLVDQRRFDGAADLASVFAMQVMPDAVGLPQEGREHLLPYANINFNAMGPKNALYEKAVADAGDAPAWVLRQCKREKLLPGGFGAQIFDAMDAGELEPEEAELLVRVFLTAALDTTIFGIGLGLHSFATNPEQWQQLLQEPTLVPSAFDEILRHTAPSPFIGRTTAVDVEIGGARIPADDKVIMFVAAANRDPRRWERPDDFDVRRKPTGHVAFGVGIHGCVGQMVARLEAEVVFNALVRRVKSFELDGPPRIKPTNWLRGFASLPLAVVPR